MKLHVSSLVVVVLVAAGTAPVSPQQSAQTPTFRTRVDAITVDVNATDGQGHPVTDLIAADFEIKENGKTQAITSFRRFTIDETPSDVTPSAITSLDTQEREAARDDVRLIAILLDISRRDRSLIGRRPRPDILGIHDPRAIRNC